MGIDLEQLRREYNRLDNPATGSDIFYRPPDGECTFTIRILPPMKGKALPWLTARTQRINNKTLYSPMQLVDGRWVGFCPMHNYWKSLYREAEKVSGAAKDALIAEARKIKPLDRYYYNVLVRSHTDAKSGQVFKNFGPKVWSVGEKLHKKILRAFVGDISLDEPPIGDITDPMTGRDLKVIKRIVKSGAESFPNYDESRFLNESPLGTADEVARWISQLHDLDSIKKVLTIDELNRELRIHQGLEKNPDSTDFNFGHAKEPAAPATTAVRSESPSEVHVSAADEDESLSDDEFVKALKDMKL